jgi:DNA-binding response OmpR family regulator
MAASTHSSRRILLAEDQDDLREMLRMALEFAGHQVFEAPDGHSAVRVALAERPDAALIDLGLPGCDGYEVARRLRQTCGAAIRLVALTGRGGLEDRTKATDAGFDVYLIKPVTAARITATLA